jgi:hypothetical protein
MVTVPRLSNCAVPCYLCDFLRSDPGTEQLQFNGILSLGTSAHQSLGRRMQMEPRVLPRLGCQIFDTSTLSRIERLNIRGGAWRSVFKTQLNQPSWASNFLLL